jgi:hypothetical protein
MMSDIIKVLDSKSWMLASLAELGMSKERTHLANIIFQFCQVERHPTEQLHQILEVLAIAADQVV